METTKQITVEASIKAPLSKVWEFWSKPQHIIKWCYASDDWHSPSAENDLQVGSRFKTTMAAKDGSVSFDFGGTYTAIEDQTLIAYALDDGRKVKIEFIAESNNTRVIETFDPETINPEEMQRGGWQAILNNFKAYTEAN